MLIMKELIPGVLWASWCASRLPWITRFCQFFLRQFSAFILYLSLPPPFSVCVITDPCWERFVGIIVGVIGFFRRLHLRRGARLTFEAFFTPAMERPPRSQLFFISRLLIWSPSSSLSLCLLLSYFLPVPLAPACWGRGWGMGHLSC